MKSTPEKLKTPVPSKTSAKTKPSKRTVKPENSFPIVAIGASAGGLEAITQLLHNLAVDTGMAFVYVQHLSPDHESILTTLLAKATDMKVQEVENNMRMLPNNVYVIPPDKEMTVKDGHIGLAPRLKTNALNLPINAFFCSLAEIHKENAIGIILSGSAHDGTIGMKAIKHEGGLTFAQDDSAKFNSMPHSAIAEGVVDFILSPKDIALELARLSKHPFIINKGIKKGQEEALDNNDSDLKQILKQLNQAVGVDFSLYKMNTIKRRIIRRMLLYKIKTIGEYAALLSEKSAEIDILYQDLLINVTSFFRDSDTHQYLKTSLLPRLLKSKTADETLRIWVPACSTGEEAYSIAMLLLEIQGNKSDFPRVQIFATDLSAKAIVKARIGEYSKHDVAAVSPVRLQRFYAKSGNNYRISKAVREMCVFAPHNILNDPPFSRLDFISCCNLLIYLDTAAQKKVISTFHYALNETGYLMLGKSENVGSSTALFTGLNKKYKIFVRKKNSGARVLSTLSQRFVRQIPSEKQVSGVIDTEHTPIQKMLSFTAGSLDSAIDKVLITSFMPASVVINQEMEILQFRGETDLYLTHAPGRASLNILKMVRPEIAFELRNAVSKAVKTKNRVQKNGLEIKINDAIHIIGLEAVPLKIEWEEPLVLILFTEHEQVDGYLNKPGDAQKNSAAKDRRIKKLEEELAAARAEMHAYIQQQDAFTEELQSANEEVVSANEELQTVNEELETSKEEIESTNEELSTTNQELQTRNDLLHESYEYAEAIIATINEPILILDHKLCIKSANKAFYTKFKVKEAETEGVLLYDLGNKQWDIPRLRALLEDIIPKNSYFYDYELTHNFPVIGEKVMLLNASRVVQKTHQEQLILLFINDITESAMLRRKEKERLEKDISESLSNNQKLEQAVADRTAEIERTNEELALKNDDLKKMNKELESFTYVSSHDLQEPLRKIQTFAGRILEKEQQNLSENGKNYFSRMQDAAKRMQVLIEDLLLYSRTRTSERTFENTDLNVLIEEVKTEMKEVILEKHASIKYSKQCTVQVIPFQFRQLLRNLISNALKFSKPDVAPLITIKSALIKGNKLKIQFGAPEKEYCHISVADNGIGFDPEYKDRIFEIFQRLHGKNEYEGTGIGLAIVKKIVENHNGVITASGEPGKGARFDIYFPTQ
ncbi:MAG: chemotaxis protein CheB [Bacteroidota bacterium]